VPSSDGTFCGSSSAKAQNHERIAIALRILRWHWELGFFHFRTLQSS